MAGFSFHHEVNFPGVERKVAGPVTVAFSRERECGEGGGGVGGGSNTILVAFTFNKLNRLLLDQT